MGKYKIKSLALNCTSLNANSIAKAKTLFTCDALIIKPVITVLEKTFPVNQVIFIRASSTVASRIFATSLNLTHSTFEFIVWKAVSAYTLFISQAAISNWFAISFWCEVESAFAWHTSVVIQYSALVNIAVLAIQSKWSVTLLASVGFGFVFAS